MSLCSALSKPPASPHLYYQADFIGWLTNFRDWFYFGVFRVRKSLLLINLKKM